MNFERINTLLTLIANAGVVLGLVFLGIEIQLSRSATEAATYHAQATEIQEANQNFALSDYLPEIYDKLENDGLGSLDSVELRRLKAWETARIRRMRSQVQQADLGFLAEGNRSGVVGAAATQYLPLWEALELYIMPEFLEAMNSSLRN